MKVAVEGMEKKAEEEMEMAKAEEEMEMAKAKEEMEMAKAAMKEEVPKTTKEAKATKQAVAVTPETEAAQTRREARKQTRAIPAMRVVLARTTMAKANSQQGKEVRFSHGDCLRQ